MSYVYVASPYSSPDPSIQEERFYEAMTYTAWLIKQGQIAYSPIVHCHEMAIKHNFPGDAAFWKKFDVNMIVPALSIHILCIPGWEYSKGVTGEIELGLLVHKPIFKAYKNSEGYEVFAY